MNFDLTFLVRSNGGFLCEICRWFLLNPIFHRTIISIRLFKTSIVNIKNFSKVFQSIWYLFWKIWTLTNLIPSYKDNYADTTNFRNNLILCLIVFKWISKQTIIIIFGSFWYNVPIIPWNTHRLSIIGLRLARHLEHLSIN